MMTQRHMYLFFLFGFVLTLVGCDHQKDFDYFIQHPSQVGEVYRACSSLSPDVAAEEESCVAVQRAVVIIQPLLLKLTQSEASSQAFGADLLAMQIKLVHTQQQLREAKKPAQVAALQQSVATQQQKVDVMLALIRWVWNVSRQQHR